ncbi:MAG: GNAT family N-acetyltransferase [Anaerovoracaceae bacterium]
MEDNKKIEDPVLESEGLLMERTDDYETLVRFFIENELEYDEEDEDEVDEDITDLFRVTDRSGKLVGACCLALREGEYIIDGIAVDPRLRGKKIGERMLHTLCDVTRAHGGNAIYLVARAPGFFRKNGFVNVSAEEAPTFYECASCPQNGVTCHPEIMKLEVDNK